MMQDKAHSIAKSDQLRWLKGWRLAVLAIGPLILIPALFFSVIIFGAQPVKVEGHTMSPALNNGDRILLSKQVNQLERGEIVVFRYPPDKTKSFIKRVIGLPGETISVSDEGRLSINNVPMDEPYVPPARNQHPRPFTKTVEADHYFLMGDSRDISNDSRSFGAVPRRLIYGKYLFRYWTASP